MIDLHYILWIFLILVLNENCLKGHEYHVDIIELRSKDELTSVESQKGPIAIDFAQQ